MNAIDACVLAMLAIIDLAIIIQLRRRRSRAAQVERVMRSLEFAVRREIEPTDSFGQGQHLLRVS